jgi:RNA polymerase sigma-70 factor, ECF subfamily
MRDEVEAAEPVRPGEEPRPDTPEFEVFFEIEHGRLFGTLCLATGDASEAEELMQEAFLKLWEHWDQVQTHPDPRGYLYRTAFNLHRNRLRRAVRAARRMVMPARSEDPFAELVQRETLIRALRALSPRQRAALVLTELLDMTSQEAAEVLEVRPSTVRALATQGRAALRAGLEEGDD